MAAHQGVSRMLPEREHEKHLFAHREKMKKMPAQIDNSTPPPYLHLEVRLKRLEMEEQRKREIDRDNRILLQKMSEILSKNNENGNSKDKKRSKSLNDEQRQHERDRLEEENVKAAKRLESTKPIYNSKKWEEDYKQKQKLMESWQRTKQKKGHGKNEDQEKLPPINGAQPKEEKKSNSGDAPPNTARSRQSDSQQNTSRTERSQSPKSARTPRKQNKNNPDRELWMYYGIRPGDSDDENDFYNQSPYLDPAKEKERRRKHREGRKTTDVDAKELRKVAKRMAPPHDIITRTLAKKSFQHRMKVKEKYKESYDVELEEDLKNGLGSEWNVLIEALLNEQNVGQGKNAGRAVKGGDAVTLVKKVAPLSEQELNTFKEDYEKENSSSLESDIADNFKNPVKMFLLTLVSGKKKEQNKDKTAALKDAHSLLENEKDRWTSKKSTFIKLVEKSHLSHMRNVFENYKKITKASQ
uniref:Uncharacterized protein n=1 Tax=Biomphalaria glabrata TaxID=6526 RepID=A0A2C9LIW0_BIOGL